MTAALSPALHRDGVCPGCNGNQYFTRGDEVVWCHVCQPARALGQERIRDCRHGHKAAAMRYWAGRLTVAWVVTLAGKRKGQPATHDYHVTARSLAGAIQAAINNNFILDGKARVVSVRLCCPCDARGWK